MRELPAHASRLQASSVLVPIVPEKRAPRYRNQDRLTACRGRVCIGFAGEPLRLPGLLIVGIEIPGPMPVAAQTPSYPGSIPMIVSHGLLRAVASSHASLPRRREPQLPSTAPVARRNLRQCRKTERSIETCYTRWALWALPSYVTSTKISPPFNSPRTAAHRRKVPNWRSIRP
jgi:hypothetical protein